MALQSSIDKSVEGLSEIPYTLSYVIRKRIQVDNLNELPREKRPPDSILWDGSSEDIEHWLDRVLNRKSKEKDSVDISLMEIEG